MPKACTHRAVFVRSHETAARAGVRRKAFVALRDRFDVDTAILPDHQISRSCVVPATVFRAALEDVVLRFERESAGDVGPRRGRSQGTREEEEGDELSLRNNMGK